MVDKIASDSDVPGFSMRSGTCPEVGSAISSGHCLVVDSLSKRRAVSGIRTGYLLAESGVVGHHAIDAFGGCPLLVGATVIADELHRSVALHEDTAKGARTHPGDSHAQDLLRMRTQVVRNFDHARSELDPYWEYDTWVPGNFNCIIRLRASTMRGGDLARCRLLFTHLVTCYPLSVFTLSFTEEQLTPEPDSFDVRLTTAMDPHRFTEVVRRPGDALSGVLGGDHVPAPASRHVL